MFCGEHCCSADPPPDPPPDFWSSLTCFHCSGGRGGRPASSLFTCSGLTSGHPGLEEVGCLCCFSTSFLRSLFPQISPAGEGGKQGSPIFRQPRAIRTVGGLALGQSRPRGVRSATWVVEGRSGCWVSRASVYVSWRVIMPQEFLGWLRMVDCWFEAYDAFLASVVREGLSFGSLGF